MRKDPSSPKYIRVEVRTGPIVREVIRVEAVGQTVETEDSMEIIDLDKTIETTPFEETLEDMEDRIIEEKYRDNRHNEYNRGRNRSRERTFSRNRERSSSNSRSRSGS